MAFSARCSRNPVSACVYPSFISMLHPRSSQARSVRRRTGVIWRSRFRASIVRALRCRPAHGQDYDGGRMGRAHLSAAQSGDRGAGIICFRRCLFLRSLSSTATRPRCRPHRKRDSGAGSSAVQQFIEANLLRRAFLRYSGRTSFFSVSARTFFFSPGVHSVCPACATWPVRDRDLYILRDGARARVLACPSRACTDRTLRGTVPNTLVSLQPFEPLLAASGTRCPVINAGIAVHLYLSAFVFPPTVRRCRSFPAARGNGALRPGQHYALPQARAPRLFTILGYKYN